MKKIIFMFFSVCLLVLNLPSTQARKAVVVADKANIYAEPNSRSYLIETVNKGAILTLFQPGKIRNEWYYITFRSPKKNCKISGFIQSLLIEFFEESKKGLQFKKNIKAEQRKKPENLALKEKTTLLIKKKKLIARKKLEDETFSTLLLSIQKLPREKKFILDDFPSLKNSFFVKMALLPTPLFKRTIPTLNPSSHALARSFPNLRSLTRRKESYQNRITAAMPSLRLHLDKSPTAFRERDKFVFQRVVEIPSEVKVQKLRLPSFSLYFSAEFFSKIKKDDKTKLPTKPIEASVAYNQKTPLKMNENVFKELKIPVFSGNEESFFQKTINLPLAIEKRELTGLKAQTYFQTRPFSALRAASQRRNIMEKEAKTLPLFPGLAENFPSMKFREGKNMFPLSQEKKIEEKTNPLTIRKRLHTFPAKTDKKKYYSFTLGVGYGQSQGGLGIFIQFNTKAGISFHGGAGYYPSSFIYSSCHWVKNVVLFSGGFKYYLPLKIEPLVFYLDLQLGGLGVEAAQIFKEIWYYSFVYDYRQKTLWGAAILSGAELRLGKIGLNGALGLAHNLNRVEWLQDNIFLTFDFGFLLYF